MSTGIKRLTIEVMRWLLLVSEVGFQVRTIGSIDPIEGYIRCS